jgi:hypothetical protein
MEYKWRMCTFHIRLEQMDSMATSSVVIVLAYDDKSQRTAGPIRFAHK